MISFMTAFNLVRSNWIKNLFNQRNYLQYLQHTVRHYSNHNDDKEDKYSDLIQQELLQDILNYNLLNDLKAKNVVVIMPRQKKGEFKKTLDQGQRLLEETITLAKTIPYWSVTSSQMISTSSINSRVIFGSTNLDQLREYVKYVGADVILFAIDTLRPRQYHFFRNFFQAEIFDRFSTVLKIFRERLLTKEAKLQLYLAEIDYVKKNLHNLKEDDFQEFGISKSFGGNFDTYYKLKKQILQEQENRLKKALVKMANSDEIKRHNRFVLELPSVAVVGYTNSGKTSLIKALTHDSSLMPKDYLFATLAVTTHELTLPSKMKALMIDTIGFISDIPKTLFHCFETTLKEICMADLIVHVVDVSHPDKELQIKTVQKTLKDIGVSDKLLDTMIEVSNKIDKVSNISGEDFTGLPISATERIGLDLLIQNIQKALIENTNRFTLKLRIHNGGEEFQWLYKEASIVECESDDDDPNYLFIKIIITKSKLGKFINKFRNKNLNLS